MRSLKSLALMFAVNLLFVITLSAVLLAFHVQISLAAWALIFGFGGAFLSLFLSKWLVKRMFHMAQIHQGDAGVHGQIWQLAAETAQRARIPMPEIWIYSDARPNAFATGATRKSSMIAVSSALLGIMDANTMRAILGHEMGHISNGDMLSTTLLMGLMNSYVIWLGNMAGRYLGNNFLTQLAITIGFEIGLSFLALIPITAFSRHREYAADAFSAKLWGREPMIAALRRLEAAPVDVNPRKESLATSYIHGPVGGLFATHPSMERRIAALMLL